MKKIFSLLLAAVMVFGMAATAFAAGSAVGPANETTEQLSPSAVLADPELIHYLKEHDKLDVFYQAQEEIRDYHYNRAEASARESSGAPDITAEKIRYISEKYGLRLPNETESGVIDSGTIYVQRDPQGGIVHVWYLYRAESHGLFPVKVALLDANNPFDSMSETIRHYYLKGTSMVPLGQAESLLLLTCSEMASYLLDMLPGGG